MATQSLQFGPKSFDLFSSNQPALLLENGTTIPVSGYSFTTNGQIMFRKFCARAYLSGNLTCRIRWYSQTGQTSGNAQLSAAIAVVTPGDAQSLLTKALATATNTTTTVNGTARGDTTTDVTISNLDSLAEGDDVWLAVSKIGGTITGGVVIVSVEILYAATGGAGAGNVSNAGGSTDNAIARFDLATGQVLQDSVVTVADTTGNIVQPAGGLLNGVDITNHDARHLPNSGTDSIFPGTYAAGDIAVWNGSAWVPKFRGRAVVTSLFTMSTTTATLFDITGLTLTIPRAGTYGINVCLMVAASSTTPVMSYALNCANVTAINYVATLWQTNTGGNTTRGAAVNALLTDAAGQTAATVMQKIIAGGMTVSAGGAFAVRIQRSSATGTVTVPIGAWVEVFEL